MPIVETRGNLFDKPCHVKVITINLVGAMGAGVARGARDTIPGLYKHYQKMYRSIRPDQFIVYNHQGTVYLLVPTKVDWRDDSPYDLVISNLQKLGALACAHPDHFRDIVMPPLGCGNGGLDWQRDVRPAAYEAFAEYPYDVLVPLAKRHLF